MLKLLLVFVGGGVGAVLRFLLQHALNPPTGSVTEHAAASSSLTAHWPWGTLLANTLGCIAIGVIGGLASARPVLDEPTRLVLVVGLLGGFTTFSALAGESLSLWSASPLRALAYLATTNIAGLGLAAGAYVAVRAAMAPTLPAP